MSGRRAKGSLIGESISSFAALVVGLALAAGSVPVANVATITVDTTADDNTANGNCTLREAIIAANTNTPVDNCPAGSGADTINLPAGSYTLTIAGMNEDTAATGDLDITDTAGSLTIIGAGAETTTIDAASLDRVFHVFAGVTLNIISATITGGNAPDSGLTGLGGGVRNEAGTVVIANSTLSANTAGNGGGVYSSGGTVVITNSVLSANTAYLNAGGIYNYGDGTVTLTGSTVSANTAGSLGGGICQYRGTVTIVNSTISGNSASGGGGIYNVNPSSAVTITNSTISGNSAPGDGGGIFNDFDGMVTIANSTISGNTSDTNGGGIFNSDEPYNNGGSVTINSSTITDNSADTGGGIFTSDDPDISGGSMSTENTIIAGNTGNTGADCSGDIGTLGYNLVGNISGCTFAPTSSDLINSDPLFSPLTGSPGYHPLSPSSPAFDSGNPSECTDHLGNPLNLDQRGLPRFGRCDIGAYEIQPLAFSTKTPESSLVAAGESSHYTIVLTNDGTTDIVNVYITDTLPISLTYVSGSLSAPSGSYGQASEVITWTGSVNAGEAVIITFEAVVGPTIPIGTSIANSVVISGGGEVITRTATIDVAACVYLPMVFRKD